MTNALEKLLEDVPASSTQSPLEALVCLQSVAIVGDSHSQQWLDVGNKSFRRSLMGDMLRATIKGNTKPLQPVERMKGDIVATSARNTHRQKFEQALVKSSELRLTLLVLHACLVVIKSSLMHQENKIKQAVLVEVMETKTV